MEAAGEMRPLALEPSMRAKCVFHLSQHADVRPGQEGCTGLLPGPTHTSDHSQLLPAELGAKGLALAYPAILTRSLEKDTVRIPSQPHPSIL